MKKLIYIFLILAVASAVVSCERDLEIPLPEHQSKLVINAYLYAGMPVDIYVTRSYGIIENVEIKDILVENARVEILEGDKVLDTLAYRDTTIQDPFGVAKTIKLGKYYSETVKPEAGKSYTVRVSHPTYGTATATTVIPRQISVLDTKIEQDVYVSQNTDFDGQVYVYSQSLIKVKVEDPAGEKNFYNFEVGIDFELPSYPGVPFYGDLYTTNNVYRNPGEGYTGDKKPFVDDSFDGTIKTLEMATDLPNNYQLLSERQPLEIKKIYVKAIAVNEDYYRFKSKFDLQQLNRDTDDFGIVPVEAIIIYSNVEGGFGIVAGFNESTFEF
ncbi:MAG: DUF4249 domain-containing protein [Bacteroidia bacterium]